MAEPEKPSDADMAVDLNRLLENFETFDGFWTGSDSACRRALYAEHRCRVLEERLEQIAEEMRPRVSEGVDDFDYKIYRLAKIKLPAATGEEQEPN